MATLVLLASAVVAGMLVGTVGIGGVLLVPILVVCARLPPEEVRTAGSRRGAGAVRPQGRWRANLFWSRS